VIHGSGRRLLRRRDARQPPAARRRADKWATLPALLTARKACGETAKRAKPEPGRRTRPAWVPRATLDACVPRALHAGRLIAPLASAAPAEATGLDGGDVLETDVPQSALDASPVHAHDRDLQEVERALRPMHTGLLAVRPLFVRPAPRPRAHVLGTMLAVQVGRARRRALVAAFGTTEDAKRAVTVAEALVALARLCLRTSHVQDTAVTRLPTPDERQEAILKA